ncbi:hypothetical protein GQ53DRAFT_116105 [Thozetella sp. PMI_491]|nr:hypothetical protein GQ53DRAFT_116105 [Thozetella sp. PMI_491]
MRSCPKAPDTGSNVQEPRYQAVLVVSGTTHCQLIGGKVGSCIPSQTAPYLRAFANPRTKLQASHKPGSASYYVYCSVVR